jgi:hypothetical protein
MGASIGHSTSPRNPLLVVVSMGFIAVYTFLPIFKEYVILPNSDGTKHELSTKKTDYGKHQQELSPLNSFFLIFNELIPLP